MKVFTAVMMDHDRMANHNSPDTLAAATRAELEQKMRQHILDWSWHINMPEDEDGQEKESLTEEQVLTTELNELLVMFQGECYDQGYSWSIEEVEM